MTFTFTMDAFPGYTYFNPTRKVLCAMQIVEDAEAAMKEITSVFPEQEDEILSESEKDSVTKSLFAVADINDADYGGLGKAVADLISADTTIDEAGRVKGMLKYVTGYTGFNSANPDEQEGYFFPFTMNVEGATNTNTLMTFVKNGLVTKSDLPYDPEMLVFVDKGKRTTFEVMLKDIDASDDEYKTYAKIRFNLADFEEKQ